MKTKKNGTLDQISRQAAIDVLNGEITVTGEANAKAVLKYIRDVSTKIRNLPSIQPEIILCKDCTWCQNIHGKVFCSREGAMDRIEPDSYCSYGERETDGSDITLPSIPPETMPENEFLDFLWNVINPNDMEKYLSMYHSKEEKRSGADMRGEQNDTD